MTDQEKQVVILTGMHRSGTSLIAAYLKQLGVHIGEQLEEATIHNQKGYFEEKKILELNRSILKEATKNGQKGWKDWGFTEDLVFEKKELSKFKEKAQYYINERKATNHKIWGWKEPRTSLLLDFWDELLPNAFYVLIYRNPWEVKSSIDALNHPVFNENPQYGFQIWKLYNEKILEFKKKNPGRCVLVSANKFMQNPARLASLLSTTLNLKLALEKSLDYTLIDPSLFNRESHWDQWFDYENREDVIELNNRLHEEADLPGDKQNRKYDGQKRITAVIPCYNQGNFLKGCLISVLRSSNQCFNIIVLNDGSTDESTLKIFKEVEKKGINVIHQGNMGLGATRNKGIAMAKTEYVLPLDADNKIDPELIIQAVQILEQEPEVGVVYSNKRLFGDINKYEAVPEFKISKILAGNYIDALTVFRKKVWEDNGGFETFSDPPGYEDWEFWINTYSHGWQFKKLDDYLFDYRVTKGSMIDECNLPANQIKVHQPIYQKHKALYEQYSEEIFYNLKLNFSHVFQSYHAVRDTFERAKDQLGQELRNANRELKELNEKLQKLTEANFHLRNSKFHTLRLGYDKFKFMLSDKGSNNLTDGGANPAEPKPNVFSRIFRLFSKNVRGKLRVVIKLAFKKLYMLLEDQEVVINVAGKREGHFSDPYGIWRAMNQPKEKDLEIYKSLVQYFSYTPKISVILPVYNPPVQFLLEAIESVKNQIYENWELCISDDCSTDTRVKKLLDSYQNTGERIKIHFRKENGHISANSNSAIELATGEFIALLDHDDLLAKEALYEIVKVLNDDPSLDFLYSDEDKVDESGNFKDPHFKPDFCLDNMLSRNYITHLAVLRLDLVNKIGCFRIGYEGSQDYDLFLRAIAETDKIYHIPKILYHWRLHSGSVAQQSDVKTYAYDAGEKAITDFLEKRNEPAKVKLIKGLPGFYTPRYELRDKGKVSIIIPSKDQASVLKTCIDSIINKSTYDDYEIILLNNNSSEKSFFDLMRNYEQKLGDRFKPVECSFPFNYSKLMNVGEAHASGKYLALLNNDMEVITPDWIEGMMEQAQRKEIGCVGAKLLFHNDTIQHAGVVIGLGGVAGHTFIGQYKDAPGYHYYLKAVSNYSAVTAACLMIRKEIFEQVSGFDESLEVEYNDVDFCLKVKEAGYRNIFIPHVSLYHYESLSRGHPQKDEESRARHIREVGIIKSRWKKYIDHDPCYNPNLTLDVTDFSLRI